MNDTIESQGSNLTPLSQDPQPTVESQEEAIDPVTPKTPDKKSSKEKIKDFLRTTKGKLTLGVLLILCLACIITGGSIMLLNKPQPVEEPELVISKDISSDKIYDNFDFIYKDSDNRLVASKADNSQETELVKSKENIIQFEISPDKKKIVYLLSDKNYKSKVTSQNMDLTQVEFPEVGFKIYQLDLDSGENKLIWETESYKLGSTSQQIYKKKMVVYPDSYVVSRSQYYDSNGNYHDEPYSYPVSYVDYVDDIDSGYQTTYIPYDLSQELNSKAVRILSYSSDSNMIAISFDRGILVKNLKLGTEKFTKDTFTSKCETYSGAWDGNYLNIGLGCYYSDVQDYPPMISYRINADLTASKVFEDKLEGGGQFFVAANNEEALTLGKVEYGGQYGYEKMKTSINRFNFDSNREYPAGILGKDENPSGIKVIGTDELFLASHIYGNKQYSTTTVNIYKYSAETEKISLFRKFELPADFTELTYNATTNIVYYYVGYQGASDSIWEYKKLDLNTNQSEVLFSKKINSNIRYNYVPVVWIRGEKGIN